MNPLQRAYVEGAGLADAESEGPLVTRRLADVSPREVEWLWPHRVPRGKLSVLAGDPGVGKTFLATAVAAAVSTGSALPGCAPQPPAHVLLVSFEDDVEDTLRPRAEALDADLDRLHVLDGVRGEDGRVEPFGPRAVVALDAWLKGREQADRPVLLVIDPWSAFVGAGVDLYRENEVRGALEDLRALAARWHVAVLLIAHLRKSAAHSALARLSGSGALGALVRSVLFAGRDPDDESVCALAHIKYNLAGRQPTLGYCIDGAGFSWTGERPDLDGERLAGHDDADDRADRDAAVVWLTALLSGGAVKSSDVYRAADAAGLSKDQAKRAKRKLGVLASKDGMEGPWLWSLPKESTEENTEESTEGSEGSGDTGVAPFAPFTPFALPSEAAQIGPCVQCTATTRRYGEGANPLCPSCRGDS